MPEAETTIEVLQPHLLAWQRLLRAHAAIVRQLDAELQEHEQLTLSDYDVLVQLREAERGALRMGDLSRCTMLTRSGMTRLVDGLVKAGHVERRACGHDARVTWAVLTDAGRERLAQARAEHHRGIQRVFAAHLDHDTAEQLAEALGRLPAVRDTEARIASFAMCDEPGAIVD